MRQSIWLLALVAWAGLAQAQTNVENFETGSLTGPLSRWSWQTGGNAVWACTMTSPHGGSYCAKAGGITHNQTSYLETRYSVNTSATISFWYKTDTESGKDLLKFYIDGSLKLTDSGSKAWTQFTSAQAVTTGPHTFRWEFTRDASGDYGSNMVWLDDIVFPLADGLTVISPSQTGEIWFSGEPHDIRWISMGPTGSTVTLEYTTDNKNTWRTIVGGVANAEGANRYSWTFVPSDLINLSPDCFIRVRSGSNPSIYGDCVDRMYLWTLTEDFETGNLADWPWRTTWWYSWRVVNTDPYHGATCVQQIPLNSDSSLKLQIEIKCSGYVGFFFKKTAANDWFRFRIDGLDQYTTSQIYPWTPVTVPISAGFHTLEWMYDDTGSGGPTVQVDAIHFPADAGIVVCEPDGADPNGTEGATRQAWLAGDTQNITWKSFGDAGTTVVLEYSTDGGSTWKPITSGVANSPGPNSYGWVIPAENSTLCKVRVRPSANPTLAGISPGTFVLMDVDEDFETGDFGLWPWRTTWWYPWQVVNTTPYHGAECAQQIPLNSDTSLKMQIEMKSAGFVGFFFKKTSSDDWFRFRIDGNEEYATYWNHPWSCVTVPISAGFHTLEWMYDDTGSGGANVQVDAVHFPVGAGIIVCEPNGPDPNGAGGATRQTLLAGDTEYITWKSYGSVGATVDLEYSTDGGASWKPIAAGVANSLGSNSYGWLIPTENSTLCKVRVKPPANPTLAGSSPGTFVIMDLEEDFESGDLALWPWRTTWWYPWQVVNTDPYHGFASALPIPLNSNTSLKMRIEIKRAGFVGFFFKKTSSDDWFRFRIDGNEEYATYVDHPWSCVTVPISAGVHTLEWMYDDTGWGGANLQVDAVHFPVDTGIIVCEPNGPDPNGTGGATRQTLLAGDVESITWKSYGSAGAAVDLEYSTDGGLTWKPIAAGVANSPGSNSYGWSVPAENSTSCKVRVKPQANPTLAGSSPGTFVIMDLEEDFESGDLALWPWRTTWWYPWQVVNTDPYHGFASALPIPLNSNTSLKMRIEIKRAGFVGFFFKKTSSDDWFRFRINGHEEYATYLAHPWSCVTAPINAGVNTLEWMYDDTGWGGANLQVDAVHFPVDTGIIVCEPGGLEPNGVDFSGSGGDQVWLVGDTENVTWHSYGNVGNTATIQYSDDNKLTWRTVTSNASNAGAAGALRSYPWTLPNIYSMQKCWVRVIPNAAPALYGDNADAFTVWGQDEGFENGLTAWPWVVGAGWTATGTGLYRGLKSAMYVGGAGSSLKVTLNLDTAGFIGFFYRKTTASDYLRFKINGVESYASYLDVPWTNVQVLVTAGQRTLEWMYDDTGSGGSTVYLDSIAFTPLLQFTSPTGSEVWNCGTTQPIAWQYSLAAGATVALSYSSDQGTSWVTIAPAAPNVGQYVWLIPAIPTSSTLIRILGSRGGSDQTSVFLQGPPILPPLLGSEPPFTAGTTNSLSWSTVPGAAGYYLEWSTAALFTPPAGNSGWTTATAHLATGLLDGRLYYYRVKCRNASLEESGWSNIVASRQDATAPTTPGTPTDRGVYTSSTTVAFAWTAASDPGTTPSAVATYRLQVGTSPGGSNILDAAVGNVLATTVTAPNGLTLYARVRASDLVGNVGPWSANSDGILIDTSPPASAVAPLPARQTETSVSLAWSGQDAPGGSGLCDFTIYVSTNGGTFTPLFANTTAASATFVGQRGRTYAFYSRACDNAGNVENAPAAPDATIELIGPSIACSPTSLSVQRLEGGRPTSATLLVSNGTTYGTVLAYTISTTPTWLSCTPTTGTSAGEITTHTVWIAPAGLNGGDYDATITIAAAEAGNSPIHVPVALRVNNVLPTARIVSVAPNPAQPPTQPVSFSGASSDVVGVIVARQWRSDLDGQLSTGESFSRSSNQLRVGSHAITFTVWDDEGGASSDTAALTVLNALPTATILSMTPNPVARGAMVTLTLAGQDNDELGQSVVDGELTWPDGVHSGVLPGVRSFAAPASGGSYTIRYRVRDDEGAWSAASTRTLTVLQIGAPVMAAEPTYTSGTTNRVSWGVVSGATAYYLQWSANSSFNPVTGNSGWIAATQFTATNLANGQTYYYRARARDVSLNESDWSNVVHSRQDATAPTAPGTPTDAGLYSASTSVWFNWTAATDGISGVASYDLQVGTYPGASNVFNGNVGNVLTRTVTGANGQTLYARVRARDRVGNIGPWSGNSNGILIDTAAPAAPGTPTDRGAYTSSTAVWFNWTPAADVGTSASGIASYDLQVGTRPGASNIFNGNVGNATTRTVTGADGQRLYARVRARDRAGNVGPWSSNSDGILIDVLPPTVPGTPADIGSYTTTTAVRFNWAAATDVGTSASGLASYDLQVGTSVSGANIFDGIVGNVLFYTVAAANGQTLYARVRGRDNAGNLGAWSAGSNGITVIVPCANNGLAIALGVAEIQCSWHQQAKPTGARGWELRRSTSGLPGSYARIHSKLLSNAEYVDTGLTRGTTYYYIVYLIDADGNEHQWTPPFSATTPLTTGVGRWRLYR